MLPLGKNGVGHAVSTILNHPELCDDLCANVIRWLVVIQGMMAAYFPDEPSAQQSVAVDGATRLH